MKIRESASSGQSTWIKILKWSIISREKNNEISQIENKFSKLIYKKRLREVQNIVRKITERSDEV